MKHLILAATLILSTAVAQAGELPENREKLTLNTGGLAVEVAYESPSALKEVCSESLSESCSLEHLNTTVNFSNNVLAGSKHLFKGEYNMTVNRKKNQWDLVFTPIDAIDMQPAKTVVEVEGMSGANSMAPAYDLKRGADGCMEMALHLGNQQIPLKIRRINSDYMLQCFKKLKKKDQDWRGYYQAAMYCHSLGIMHPKVAQWAQKANELKDNANTRELLASCTQ